MSEQLLIDETSLTCNVSTNLPCPPVMWLYSGSEVAFRSMSSTCSVTLIFPSRLPETHDLGTFSCQVGTEPDVFLFKYTPNSKEVLGEFLTTRCLTGENNSGLTSRSCLCCWQPRDDNERGEKGNQWIRTKR